VRCRCCLAYLDANLCGFDKEGAEPNFKGFGLHPLLAYCDNTGEPPGPSRRPCATASRTRRPADPRLPPARLKIQASWPWAADIVTAWDRIVALP
jgi:hypothetical protein